MFIRVGIAGVGPKKGKQRQNYTKHFLIMCESRITRFENNKVLSWVKFIGFLLPESQKSKLLVGMKTGGTKDLTPSRGIRQQLVELGIRTGTSRLRHHVLIH